MLPWLSLSPEKVQRTGAAVADSEWQLAVAKDQGPGPCPLYIHGVQVHLLSRDKLKPSLW